MGGIRPSGLHINKPAVFGIFILLVGCFGLYKFMWSESTFSPISKDENPTVKDRISTKIEIDPKPLDSLRVKGKSLTTEMTVLKGVVWNASQLIDSPVLSDTVKETLLRKSDTLELAINGQKFSSHVEISVMRNKTPSLTVLFLHGAKFTSHNWIEINVLDHVASWGFQAVAVDLPGYGNSKATIDDPSLLSSYLPALIAALQITKPVIVSPSMSGKYSLPFLFGDPEKSTEKASGFVPVAPTDVKNFSSAFEKSRLPTLIVYGTTDSKIGVPALPFLQRLSKSVTAPMAGAGHACYLDDPATFIKYLYSFLVHLSDTQ